MEEVTVTTEDSGNRLFVGNLPFRMSRDEVFDLFAQAGSVLSVHMPTDRETGRPRGFGFVEMEDAGVMEQAIQMFNGYSVDGRALVVNQARPREERPSF
jgi:RNA recognition motif-containing protein